MTTINHSKSSWDVTDMEEIIFNAENAIAGRLASTAAKALLKGKRVRIVNAEKAVVTGDKSYTIRHFQERRERGDPYKGPFYPRTPDRILKRMVRGMMPYKKPMGKKAFQQLRVYLSVPEEFQGREFISLPGKGEGITLEQLSQRLKGA